MREQKYLELLSNGKIEELKELLENNIRNGIALKKNSKSRISALNRIEKSIQKIGNSNLIGCTKLNDMYLFTDSYQVALLKDNANYEINEKFPQMENVINKILEDKTKLYVDIKDLAYYTKIKMDYKNEFFNNIVFDYKLVKNALDALGGDVELFANKDKNILVFENKENEMYIILGKRVY